MDDYEKKKGKKKKKRKRKEEGWQNLVSIKRILGKYSYCQLHFLLWGSKSLGLTGSAVDKCRHNKISQTLPLRRNFLIYESTFCTGSVFFIE